ncbi:MAG: DEAD/DEAH box helicase [Desulfobulbaceae bacterium]|nr:DEAD/DEAH box helicase [Desulfobulbaceae bacterium]
MKKIILSAGNKIRKIFQAGRRRYDGLLHKPVEPQQADERLTHAGGDVEKKKDPAGEVATSSVGPTGTKDTEGGGGGKYRKPRPKPKPAWSLENFVVVPEEGKSRFHDFSISLKVMRAIADQKFEYCTPIQEKSLKEVLAGSDLVGKANTGTGKTAVFLIAILSRLLREKRGRKGEARALVLAPTRELVVQIANDGKALAKYCNLTVRVAYGGVDYQKQQDVLQNRNCDLLVATPGRLLDFINKGVVNLSRCKILVLDEADRMLDMGFIPDVRRIIGRLPSGKDRQTMLFSATVPDDVQRLASQWCVKPKVVEAEPEQVAVETVEQVVYLTTADEKYVVLYNLIKANANDRIIVFANMKNEAKRLADRLQRNDIDCVLLSGDVAQNKRMTRLENFRSGKVKILVATDVAGRGIHIEGITFVVNYTLPYEPEDYVHRIGRTGRAGADGKAVSFACEEGSFYLPEIEEYVKQKFDCVLPEESLLTPPPPRRKPEKQQSKGGYGKKPGRRPKKRNYSGTNRKSRSSS